MATMLASAAVAAEPVRRIAISVQPYYVAAATPDGAPEVDVGASFSGLLASTGRADILAARDKLAAAPDLVTPMTMMVLAIRLYDVGERDEAVFWFYAAKDRAITLFDVIDAAGARLGGVQDAIGAFVQLAGPAINGYAFCDVANQQAIRARALAWLPEHPYAVLTMEKLPALPGDRGENLARSIATITDGAAKETAYLADPQNLAAFMAARARNEMDSRFCWK
jgi:hypothetical protein